MRCPSIQLAIVALIAVSISFCQTETAESQPNTTIQLPSFANFSVNTVVSVPDGGTMSMGGVNRWNSMGIRRGIPGLPSNPFTSSRGYGQTVGASNASVHAKILNLQELESQHMQGYVIVPAISSNSVKTDPPPAVRRKAAFITNNLGRTKKR